ncbi:unnamed protein product [Phytomonas sp. Hart1]|nr:unnamed protein product [Phytomonas sp. Hart1]|eukprot:CCW71140.1 unnamed protein product [Phytomonas sp. isolate Hart1]
MDTARSISVEERSFFSYILDQQWILFALLGLIAVSLRLYNLKQRTQHNKLLRETIMVELGYNKNVQKKKNV